ncbi:unnamed protein product [Rotaria sp. Silwood2]|nr:unnamed protein product [Rotaria sp. Silwood2]
MYEDCAIIKTILECGGDPTLLDDNGQTALHIAISLENLECVKTILQYGFTHDQRNKNSFTPLMEAAYYDKIEIVDLLFNTLPRQQYINEIMLLACYYQTSSSLGTRLTEQAFDCFQEALHLQSQISNSISCEAYEFRHECQTSDELIFIRNDEHAMLIQALLVYERLLPSRGEMHILVSILIGKMFQYYVQRGWFSQCIPMLMHAYNLSLSCKENMVQHMDDQSLSRLRQTICFMIRMNDIASIKKDIHIFEWIVDKSHDQIDILKLCVYIFYVRRFLLKASF